MRKSPLLTRLALLATLFVSCSKSSDVATQDPSVPLEKLSVSDALAAAGTDTTGYDGAMACYATYFGTLENPPDDYIPGDAAITLNTCLAEYRGSSGGGGGPRLVPPAPKVILTLAPPLPTEDDDNRRYLAFFGLTTSSSDAAYAAASAKFDRFCSIVCDAIAENITYPDPSYIDKRIAGVTYATNHPDIFSTSFEKLEFLRFLPFVFERPTFIISVGSSAIRTEVNPFTTTGNCVNLVLRLTM